jgi:hypothetical protein
MASSIPVYVHAAASEGPYGIETTFRDNSGNWFSMTQRAETPAPSG